MLASTNTSWTPTRPTPNTIKSLVRKSFNPQSIGVTGEFKFVVGSDPAFSQPCDIKPLKLQNLASYRATAMAVSTSSS